MREKYLAFLKEEIEKYCYEKGCYEIFWDYDESIELRKQSERQCWQAAKEEQISIEYALSDILMEMNMDYDQYLFEQVVEDIPEEFKEIS